MGSDRLLIGALDRYSRALAVALGYRDGYTLLHSRRVVAIAEAMGGRLGLSEEELRFVSISAAFHDIGKLGIPDRILLKAGALDDDERDLIERHSEMGAEIIAATGLDGCDIIARVIRHHHEHFNGGGYPDGIAGDEIPLPSRIIGIADSYDAMAVTRSYSPRRSHEQIMAILDEEDGKKHDPQLLQIFRTVVATSHLKTYRTRRSAS